MLFLCVCSMKYHSSMHKQAQKNLLSAQHPLVGWSLLQSPRRGVCRSTPAGSTRLGYRVRMFVEAGMKTHPRHCEEVGLAPFCPVSLIWRHFTTNKVMLPLSCRWCYHSCVLEEPQSEQGTRQVPPTTVTSPSAGA